MQEQSLWKPSEQRIANANITAFMKQVNDRHRLPLREYRELWQWNVDALANPEALDHFKGRPELVA